MLELKTKECLGKCPYCGSESIDYAAFQITDDTLRYPAECLGCGAKFSEDYAIEYAETVYYEEK